jgi:endonuclease YncB( thermonuclease family)
MTLGVLAGALLLTSGFWAALGPSEAPASAVPEIRVSAAAADILVIDGATLRLPDRVVQLAGIEPPPRGQSCPSTDRRPADCGAEAARALAGLLHRGPVECILQGAGQSGRPMAVCSQAGVTLNTALVLAGWAHGDASAPGMADAEARARAARRGLWAAQ